MITINGITIIICLIYVVLPHVSSMHGKITKKVSSTIQLTARMWSIYNNTMASSLLLVFFFPLKSTNHLLFDIKVCSNKSLMHILVHCL